jgi:hypothetical protein
VRTGHWLIVLALLGLLAATAWYFVVVWTATPAMPRYGNVIMAVAAVLSLVVGCGLIALMYHSNRERYDDPPRSDRANRK